MNAIWLACSLQLFISASTGPPIVRGTLEGNKVYTSGVKRGTTAEYHLSGGGMLSILRQDIRSGKTLAVLDRQSIGGDRNAFLRWQLIDKNYYYILYSGGVADDQPSDITRAKLSAFHLPMLEAVYADGITAPDRQKRHHDYHNSTSDYFPFFGNFADPNRSESRSHAVDARIYYDIWARGRNFWELYATEGNRLTREDFHPERVKLGPEHRKRIWEKAGVWTYDWTGPFYVAANGEDRYFATEIRTPSTKKPFLRDAEFRRDDEELCLVTGSRIFVAPRNAKEGTALKEVWKGTRIVALIHDADGKTSYAFTKDQYFEIADPIQPKPHTLMIRREPTADKALEIAAKCGRLIRGLPEIKGKQE